MCVFHQDGYITLLQYLINSISIKANINKDTTDILIITSPLFQPIIQKYLDRYDLPLKYYILDLHNISEACYCKVNIFEYDEIDKYQKILYLDTDILINSDINTIFDSDISLNKIYALEEGNIGHEYWGAQFFDFDFIRFNPNSSAFNTGILYFMNSLDMKKLFKDIKTHIKTHIDSGNSHPMLYDQAFIVYNAFIENRYDNQFMNKYSENNPNKTSNKKILYHFPGGIGSHANKLEKMTLFWEKMK